MVEELPFADSLNPFQEILCRYDPRFQPSVVFLKRILTEFSDRDLALEAEAMTNWLSHLKGRRKLTPAFVVNWLKKAPAMIKNQPGSFICPCGVLYGTRSEAFACSLNHPERPGEIRETGVGDRGGYLIRRIEKKPDGKWGVK